MLDLTIPSIAIECDSTGYCEYHKPRPKFLPRSGILRASRRIYEEAIIALYSNNEFTIYIDDSLERPNVSVMGRSGFKLQLGPSCKEMDDIQFCMIDPLPAAEFLRRIQKLHLSIGSLHGIREFDINPTTNQRVAGPERPSFRPLVKTIEEACVIINGCDSIHLLRVSIRSLQKQPGDTELVMAPILALRGIRQTKATIFSLHTDLWVDWNLRPSYGNYMSQVMALPEGAVAPKYVEDPEEDIEAVGRIFALVGGRYLGEGKFAFDSDEENEIDDDDLQEWYEGYPFFPAGGHGPALATEYDATQPGFDDDYEMMLADSMYD